MISKEAIRRGYNRGDYQVGAPTQPKFARAGAPVATGQRFENTVPAPDEVVEKLRAAGLEVVTDPTKVRDGVRDWWAGTMIAETDGRGGTDGVVVAKAGTVEEVQEAVRITRGAGVPLTVSAARSNVTGSALPVHGGVVLDVCGLDRILDLDETSQIVSAEPGVFGDVFETWLQERGFTTGHWPSSFGISTVGGWAACRGAGQLSTRYGKIEDMVVGLDVVLPDGSLITTGGNPRAAVGPDLNQVFVGSEGLLGVIVGVRLRLHRLPDYSRALAFGFDTFAAGLEACRQILQRGANPAVLRLYDNLESGVQFGHGETNVLLIADEGDQPLVDAVMTVTEQVCAAAQPLDQDAILEKWLDTRYLTGKSAEGFKPTEGKGFVADTLEMAARWADLPQIYDEVVAAINSVEGTLAGSAHQSHAYVDGACLYFSLRGEVNLEHRQDWYDQVWKAVNEILIAKGSAISHHHGVGLLRSPYVGQALGEGHRVLAATKAALDPKGLFNPGKFGL
ncbi:FAD-binding oxidoreductase [Gordonia sp. DT219]|uniref:FAD-binding oxidoreductase n=1 Tax=Gordonia sp. DT219 TaxID=3416658 RepID=UPI003CE6E086